MNESQKVTIYSTSEFMGNVVKYEGKLLDHGVRKYAQYAVSIWIIHGDNNARLISASPDLLEACKTALFDLTSGEIAGDLKRNPYSYECVMLLEKAIAKAEGKQKGGIIG